MRVNDLIPGMQFKSFLPEEPGVITFIITHTLHPLYPELALVIWKMPNGGYSFDALDLRQELPYQPYPFNNPELLKQNLRGALQPGKFI